MSSIKVLYEVLHSDTESYQFYINVYIYIIKAIVLFLSAPYLVKSVGPSLYSLRRYQRQKDEHSTFSSMPLWVKSTLHIIEEPTWFFDFTLSRSSSGEPSFIQPGSTDRHLAASSDAVAEVFRQSKNLTIREYAMHVSQWAKQISTHGSVVERSAVSRSKASTMSKADQFWDDFHEVTDANLIYKDSVTFTAQRFVVDFLFQIDQLPQGKWSLASVPKLLQQHMLEASARTHAGPGLINNSPFFAESFWKYHKAFMASLTRSSDFCYKTYEEARENSIEAVKVYLRQAWSGFNWQEAKESDFAWEPKFGSRLFREREEALAKQNVSLDERAQIEFELLMSIESKTIPMTTYMVTEILQRPDLHSRICKELQQVMTFIPKKGSLELDHAKLEKLPLLLSVYCECLRFHSPNHEAWQLKQDVKLNDSTLKAGSVFLCPSYLANQYYGIWDSAKHPVDTFWPERFLNERPYYLGMHFPHGGGSAISSERHYAKQEILSAVAVVLAKFDFQVVSSADNGRGVVKSTGKTERENDTMTRAEPDMRVRLRRR